MYSSTSPRAGFGIFSKAAGAKSACRDDAGAMIIPLVLIYTCGATVLREFRLLAGISAPISFLQRVIYKVLLRAVGVQLPTLMRLDRRRCSRSVFSRSTRLSATTPARRTSLIFLVYCREPFPRLAPVFFRFFEF